MVSLEARGAGRTTKAMLDAPRNAVYVWPNHQLLYPKQLAKHLGRQDLTIVGPDYLRYTWGTSMRPIRADHALVPNSEQFSALFEAGRREEALQRKPKR